MAISYYSDLFASDKGPGGSFLAGVFSAIETEMIEALEREYSMEDTQNGAKEDGLIQSPWA